MRKLTHIIPTIFRGNARPPGNLIERGVYCDFESLITREPQRNGNILACNESLARYMRLFMQGGSPVILIYQNAPNMFMREMQLSGLSRFFLGEEISDLWHGHARPHQPFRELSYISAKEVRKLQGRCNVFVTDQKDWKLDSRVPLCSRDARALEFFARSFEADAKARQPQ